MPSSQPAIARWQTSAPFACHDFTLSLHQSKPVREVRIDDVPMQRATSRADFAEGRFLHEQGRLTLCWPLEGNQRISIDA